MRRQAKEARREERRKLGQDARNGVEPVGLKNE
jgi:hypothetical protein